ncbi:uncharacterized protein METZ01_LOCUS373773 [marine metagenome]|uniref:Uncharacterized protein n=1 Tax=marine metagenome TaxID=408172 RepID=A0A382TFL6_9ZZZZ
MKSSLIVIAALLVAGCGEINQITTEEVGEMMDVSLKEFIGGTYEFKSSTRHSGKVVRFVIADDLVVEEFVNGVKDSEYDLEIFASEISFMHTVNQDILFFRKNSDGSLTHIANHDNNRTRINLPKDRQETYIKIK